MMQLIGMREGFWSTREKWRLLGGFVLEFTCELQRLEDVDLNSEYEGEDNYHQCREIDLDFVWSRQPRMEELKEKVSLGFKRTVWEGMVASYALSQWAENKW